MTNIEAIKLLKERIAFRCNKVLFLTDTKENEAEAAAIRALKKETPKNIIKKMNDCYCSNCLFCLGDYEIRKRFKSEQNYCQCCGQRLNWE